MNRRILENRVSVTDLSKNPSATLRKTQAGATQFVVKNNQFVSVLMSIELYKAIEELSDVRHTKLDESDWASIIDYTETVIAARRAELVDSSYWVTLENQSSDSGAAK
jgi:hypothetical protein